METEPEPLSQAYAQIKAGEKAAARDLLRAYIAKNPNDEQAWSLLYYCLERPEQKRACLERVLEINPDNAKARQALDRLGASGRKGPLAWAVFAMLGLVIGCLSMIAIRSLTAMIAPPQVEQPTQPQALIPSTAPTTTPTYTPLVISTLPGGPTNTPVVFPTPVVITYTPGPTATTTHTTTPESSPPASGFNIIHITYVYYRGDPMKKESDEYAEVSNLGNAPVDMKRWVLTTGNPKKRFVFRTFQIQPGQVCRIYTNEVHPEHCGFSFESESSIWSDQGDCARLYNAKGVIVDEYCYKPNP